MKKFLFILVLFFTVGAFAQNAKIRETEFNLERKLAIQGYDPVAYFKQGKDVKGKKEITGQHMKV